MSERRGNAGLWIVLGLLVGGAGCIGAIVMLGAFAGAGFFFAAREASSMPIEPAIAPTVSAPDAGVPICPGMEDEIRLYARLTATRFTLESTDGLSYPMPYEGEAYPFDSLRRHLADRRYVEPNRRDLLVTTEPGVPASVPGRVVALAREVGFTDAIVCRERTELDDLVLGDAPGAGPEQVPGTDPGTAVGDSDRFGFGGLGPYHTGEGGGRDDGTIGLGNLGTIGHSEGSTGSGYGRGAGGLRGARTRPPLVRTGNIDVRGGLSREIVRRVVQRHVNEVRFCYEQELNAHPELEGRVEINLVISASGAVQTSAVGSSTLLSPAVESCVVRAVRRWTFPEPDGGGIVGVTVPYVLSVPE